MSRIYPEISTLRRSSENYEKIPYVVEGGKNCNQLLLIGPSLTKDLLGKMHQDLGPSKLHLFGQTLRTGPIWVLAGLLILFMTSFSGFIIMWYSSLFEKMVYQNLVLTNGSQAYKQWSEIEEKPLLKVYLFNYTNVHEFESNINVKLHVEEIGPYVYEETLERVNVQFHHDGTLSYQEKRSYNFIPHLSKGMMLDRVIVPNIPLLSGAAVNRHKNFFQRMAFSGLLKTLSETPFINVSAHQFITGYNDDLYDLSKSYLKLQNQKPMDQFGLISKKIGLQHEVIRIHTGANNIEDLGQIVSINGKDHNNLWMTDDCNKIKGSDGTMYPPQTIRDKKSINLYLQEICRPFPLEFDKETTIMDNKIPGYKYVQPLSNFDSAEKNFENQCFCNMDSGECPLQGLINATACNMGSPLFFSMPHFYNGDQSLINGVTGLKTNLQLEDIQSYAIFHPKMGFILSGSSKVQANIQVHKSFGITQLNMFSDNQMLPVSILDFSFTEDRFSPSFIQIIYQTTFLIKEVENGLKYGSLLGTLITGICIFIVLRGRRNNVIRSNFQATF